MIGKLNTGLILRRLFLSFFALILGAGLAAQSQMPPGGDYLQLATKKEDGNRDRVQTVFFEIPDTYPLTDNLYFAVNDGDALGPSPDLNTYNDAAASDAGHLDNDPDITYYLIGGTGAITGADAREYYYDDAAVAADDHIADGVILDSITFPYNAADSPWTYFTGVLPTEGEKIGNKYYFRIVAEIVGNPNSDFSGPPDYNLGQVKNAFQLDVSSADNGLAAPTVIGGARSFAYGLTLAFLRRGAATGTWNLYPFVPESETLTDYIIFSSYDLDNPTGMSASASDVDGTGAGPVTISGDTVAANTSFQLNTTGGTASNGTWYYTIVEPTAPNGPAENTSEIWVWHKTSVAGGGEFPEDGSNYTYRMYSSHYDLSAGIFQPSTVSLNAETNPVLPAGTTRVYLQILDGNDDPAPYVRNLSVELTDIVPDQAGVSATITGVSAGSIGGTLKNALVTTDSEGIGWFDITGGAGVQETVYARVYWDGTDTGHGFGPIDSFGTLASDDITVDFVDAASSSHIWVGGTPGFLTDWHTAGNWIPATVPGVTDSPTITFSAYQPSLGASGATVVDLTIATDMTLDVNGQVLQVTGTLSNNGTLLYDGGEASTSINVMDTDSGTVEYDNGGTIWLTDFFDLETTGNYTLSNDTDVNGAFTQNGGTLSGGAFTFNVDGVSDLNGSIDIENAISFVGDVTLTGDTVLDNTTGAVSTVSFGALLDDDTADTHSLTITSDGAVSFTGNIGSGLSLGLLSITAPSASFPATVASNAVSVNLSAGNVAMNGGTAVTTSNFEAAVGTGFDILLANTGNLTIGGASALTGLDLDDGTVTISNTGSLTVTEAITATGAGSINLTTSDSGGADTIIVNSAVSAASNPASVISFTSADGITINEDITAQQGTISMLGGNAQDIILTRKAAPAWTIDAGTGTVTLDAGGLGSIRNDVLANDPISLVADTINLNTGGTVGGSIGTAATGDVFTSGTVSSMTIGNGAGLVQADILISHSGGGLTVSAINHNSVPDHDISIEVTDANALVLPAAALVAGGNGDIELISGTTLTTANTITAAAGNIFMEARTGVLTLADAVTSANGSIDLEAGTNLVLTAGPSAVNGTLDLSATGTVTQGAALAAGNLLLQGTASYALNQGGNDLGQVAANLTAAGTGTLDLQDSNALVVGSVTPVNPVAAAVNGITTNGSEVSLQTGTTLTLNQPTAVGASNITLNTGAAVTQGAAGEVSGTNLALRGTGPYTLDDVNNAVGTLAASVTNQVQYVDSNALTAGSVTTTLPAQTTTGVVSTGGSVILETVTADLTVSQDISAAAGSVDIAAGGTLLLNTAGMDLIAGTTVDLNLGAAFDQGAGLVNAGNLLVQGTGSYLFDNPGNTVGTLAGNIGGTLDFRDADALTVGSVTPVFPVVAAVNGITTTNDEVYLLTGTTLTLNQPTDSGTAATTLDSGAAATQGANGQILSDILVLGDTGPYTLDDANNAVSSFAANIVSTIELLNDANLAVNSITTTVPGRTTTGISTTDAEIFITTTSAGTLTLNQPTDSGTAATTLDSAGAVTQGAAGQITSDLLVLGSVGPYTLTDANNEVATFAANASATVEYLDSNALIVGSVTTTLPGRTTNGAASSGGDVYISTASAALTVNNNISSPTGNIDLGSVAGLGLNADLAAVTGTIDLTVNGAFVQGAGDTLSAVNLLLQGTGPYTINDPGNAITTLAANLTAAGTGTLDLQDSNALVVGSVTPVNPVAAAVNGITTNGSEVSLQTGTTLTLNQPTAVGASSITLNSGAAVTQGAAGEVSGTNLALRGTGPYTLDDVNNAVGTLAASVTNQVQYVDSNALTAGSVTTTLPAQTTTGVVSTGGSVILETVTADLTVSQDISAAAGSVDIAAGGTLLLNTAGMDLIAGTTVDLNLGAAFDQGAGLVNAGNLLVQGTGSYLFDNPGNTVGTLAGNLGGSLEFRDADALTVGSVTPIFPVVAAVNGITTTNDEVYLLTGTTLTLNQPTDSGTAATTLDSGAAATQGANGQILSDILVLGDTGPYTLDDTNNAVSSFAANTVSTIELLNDANLAVNSITTTVPGRTTTGISTTDAEIFITTTSAGTLTLNQPTDSGTAATTLDSAGAVTQGAAGQITSDLLVLGSAGPYTLTDANNAVSSFAANTVSTIELLNDANLAVNSITTTVPGRTTTGITTTDAEVFITTTSAGTLTLNQPTDSGTAATTLDSAGAVTQGGTGQITSNQLVLGSVGPYTLSNANNNVNALAANTTAAIEYDDQNFFSIGNLTTAVPARTTAGITIANNDLNLSNAAGNITIARPINIGTGNLIALNPANTIVFNDATVGATLTVNGAGGITLDDPIRLDEDGIIVANGGGSGSIDLNGAIDDGTASTRSLSIDAGGDNITLDAAVGAGTPPLNLTVNAATITQNADITLAGDLTINTGVQTVAAQTIDVDGDLAGTGTLTVTGAAPINIGTDLTIGTFNAGPSSTVTFDTANATTAGAYTFFNLTLDKTNNGDTIDSTGNWIVNGTLTLTQGAWDLDDGAAAAEQHSIASTWDSNLASFSFDASGSTVEFTGTTNTSLRTKGIGTESFENIIINKGVGNTVSLLTNGVDITGDLTITQGILDVSAGNQPIQIAGNWDNNSGANTFNSRNGTVTFVVGLVSPSTLETGGNTNDFYNLVISDSVVQAQTDDLTVSNDLTILDNGDTGAANQLAELRCTAGGLDLVVSNNLSFADAGVADAAPVLDISDWNITVANGYDAMITQNALPATHEMGRLRMSGNTRTTWSFPDLSANPENMGIVEFYGGAVEVPAFFNRNHFWHIIINGANLTLNREIVVHGRSAEVALGIGGKTALTEDVDATYPGTTDLMGIHIQGGTLDLNGQTAHLFGSLYNAGGTFTHSNGDIRLVGDFPALIAGSNTFYGFYCNNTGLDETSAPDALWETYGKIVYFEDGTTTTIANLAGADFDIMGDNGSGDPADAPPGIAGLPDGTDWVYLVSSLDGSTWNFIKNINATLAMQYVYVRDSDATGQPLVIPPDVKVDNCPGWVLEIYVELSWTRDVNQNGRIDGLRVLTAAAVNMDFSGFTASVDGYTVSGYADDPEVTNTYFWINLEEQDLLDTGVTPAWRIDDNTSLIETGPVGAPLALYPSKTEENPYDDAPPIIGYTLAAADSSRQEVFIHFSEILVDTNGGGWTNNFDVSGLDNDIGGVPAAVTVVTPSIGSTIQEALLDIGGNITVNDIYTANQIVASNLEDIPTPQSPLPEDAVDGADTAQDISAIDPDHRVSDVALGILGNGIVEPVTAIGNTQDAAGSGVGIVTRFDGSDFLQDEDIDMDVHLHSDLAGGLGMDIYYDNSVTSTFKRSGLWLPNFSEVTGADGQFSGLVPRPWTVSTQDNMNYTGSGNLYDYSWFATDGMIEDGSDLEFFLHFTGPNLYSARCIDETASDWFRKIRPWSIQIQDIVTQAGGITVLNNIINPGRNESVSLHYELTSGGMVTIQVFDLAGGLVEVLQRGHQSSGEYSVSWNGRNRSGNAVARGIYFIRYVGPGGIDQIRKVLVVK